MKIAQVSPRYYPYAGGFETHVRHLSEGLAQKGYTVDVLTTDPSNKLRRVDTISGVRVQRFGSWAPKDNYDFSIGLVRFLAKNSSEYSVIHGHSYHDFPALAAAYTKGHTKFVFNPHYHGTGHTALRSLLHIPYKFVGRKLLAKADGIICDSFYERQLLTSNFEVDSSRISVIPSGLDYKEFKDLVRRRKEHRTILAVARLEEYKGLQYLVGVLPRLEQDIVLEVAGDGPYEEELTRLAKSLGVHQRVILLKHLPRKDLLQRYVDSDVFALLSKHEAYGISVAEALTAGIPCIVANASALAEWVDDKNCFGIDHPPDLNILSELITKVIGRKATAVGNPKICSRNDVVERLSRLYAEITE
jgi:glycosyltransferase involved in cell wall biosynthesis